VFIDAYQQAGEQNRLPSRRTPSPDELEAIDDIEEPDDFEG
jgi:hypothetical protein